MGVKPGFEFYETPSLFIGGNNFKSILGVSHQLIVRVYHPGLT